MISLFIYFSLGSVLNNYANIFELLTKMRQCANHPDLITKKKDASDNKQLVCMLCSEPPEVRLIMITIFIHQKLNVVK